MEEGRGCVASTIGTCNIPCFVDIIGRYGGLNIFVPLRAASSNTSSLWKEAMGAMLEIMGSKTKFCED